jgi:hypothetical protein
MNNELPSKPIGLLNLMASTSTQIDFFSDSIIQSVKQGEESALKVHVQLIAMAKASERILKEIKDNVLTEAEKYPGADFDFLGNKITKGDVYTTYDYTVCGDPVWERRKAACDADKALLDERSAFLKALKVPLTTVDDLTGEIVMLRPPLKKSTPGIKVSIK